MTISFVLETFSCHRNSWQTHQAAVGREYIIIIRDQTDHSSIPGGGGFSHWHGIRICACLLGHFFAKFGIAIGGFSSETKEPKLHKLGVFWANYCKKHPIWSKLGAFLSKMVYWWVGNLAKNWYRDSQIFEVAHPRTILVKEPPPPPPEQYHRQTLSADMKVHACTGVSQKYKE